MSMVDVTMIDSQSGLFVDQTVDSPVLVPEHITSTPSQPIILDDAPDSVVLMGTFSHLCEGSIVCKSTSQHVPAFNATIYLENKVLVGAVDEILGAITNSYFTITPAEGVIASSFEVGDAFYIANDNLLSMDRFLPKPPTVGPPKPKLIFNLQNRFPPVRGQGGFRGGPGLSGRDGFGGSGGSHGGFRNGPPGRGGSRGGPPSLGGRGSSKGSRPIPSQSGRESFRGGPPRKFTGSSFLLNHSGPPNNFDRSGPPRDANRKRGPPRDFDRQSSSHSFDRGGPPREFGRGISPFPRDRLGARDHGVGRDRSSTLPSSTRHRGLDREQSRDFSGPPREYDRDRSGLLRERDWDPRKPLREHGRDRSSPPHERSRDPSRLVREHVRDRSGPPRERDRDQDRSSSRYRPRERENQDDRDREVRSSRGPPRNFDRR